MVKTLTCIECPIGCEITVDYDGENVNSVVGNSCPRGKKYAEEEVICPRRIITTTVKTEDGIPVSVKTNTGVKKDEIFEVMKRINLLKCKLPVKIGDVIQKEIADGVDLVATCNMK